MYFKYVFQLFVFQLLHNTGRVTWSGGRGHPKPHIWNRRPQFTYSLYNLYWCKM